MGMTRHLSPAQLLDVAEGAAAAGLVAHAASCDACRARVDGLRDGVRLALSDRVPEPPPFFWEHMAARVGEAVRQEEEPAAGWRFWRRRWASAGAVAVLVVAVAAGASLWKGQSQGVASAPGSGPAAAPSALKLESSDDLVSQDDPSWNLLRALSADVVFDDGVSASVLPVPGAADRALQQLTETERIELARILRAAMAKPASADPKSAGD